MLDVILSLLAFLFAITIHEFAHAWTADRLGDPTARLQGRMTLNPVKHLDLYGLLFLIFFRFGWAKPVSYDPFNLKNPRKDGALIALSGPLSNILAAVVFSLIVRLFNFFEISFVSTIGIQILIYFIWINVSLGLFNLIPIHPLDGFSVVTGLLSREKAAEWMQLRRYGIIFLILLIIPIGSSSMLSAFLQPAVTFVVHLLIPAGKSAGVI